MSNTKVLIVIKGGVMLSVHSTEEIDMVLVDWDNIEQGQDPVVEIGSEDSLFKSGQAYQLYSDFTDPQEMEVRDELKRIKF